MGARIHIGDGAYLSHDGYYWWLTADRPGGRHEVALEPSAVVALVRHVVDTVPEMAGPIIAAAGGEG